MVVGRRKVGRGFRAYDEPPIFMMSVLICDPGIQHQVADKNVNRCINGGKRDPADWTLRLCMSDNCQHKPQCMLPYPAKLRYRVVRDPSFQEFVPMHKPSARGNKRRTYNASLTTPDRKVIGRMRQIKQIT